MTLSNVPSPPFQSWDGISKQTRMKATWCKVTALIETLLIPRQEDDRDCRYFQDFLCCAPLQVGHCRLRVSANNIHISQTGSAFLKVPPPLRNWNCTASFPSLLKLKSSDGHVVPIFQSRRQVHLPELRVSLQLRQSGLVPHRRRQ